MIFKHSLFNKWVGNETNDATVQLFRYLFVAGTAFIVDFSALFIFTEVFGIYYLLSAVFAFCLGLSTNYLLSIFWVFNERKFKKRWIEFSINALIATTGLGLNVLFIWIFTEKMGMYYLVSKVFSTAIVFWWNFLAKKKILFTAKVNV